MFTRPLGGGVGVPPSLWATKPQALLTQALSLLGPSWWYNWAPFDFHPQAYPNYIPMVWSQEMNYPTFSSTLAAHPEQIWLLFNEPHDTGQANLSPSQAFDLTKTFVRKAWDTGVEGQYASPGATMTTWGLAWAEAYMRLNRQHFNHRPGYLHFHAYSEHGMEARAAMWRLFDNWYRVWGADTPVVITEVAANNHGLPDQKRVMDDARERLATDSRIAGVAWFSLNYGQGNVFPASSLLELTPTNVPVLSPLGVYWKSLNWPVKV